MQHKSITVVTEDDAARWFLKRIIDSYSSSSITNDGPSLSFNNLTYNFLETHIGWNELVKLIVNDYVYFSNYLIVFDPDINIESNWKALKETLSKTSYKINHSQGSIFTLPGDDNVETIFKDYLLNLPHNHSFFDTDYADYNAIDINSLLDHGPESSRYSEYKDELRKTKIWFKDHLNIMDNVFPFWLEDNKESVDDFVKKFHSASLAIQHKLY